MQDIIPILGVINTDTQDRFLPKGESSDILMMEDGRFFGLGGSMVSKRGTLNVGTILDGAEKVVGTAKWFEKSRILYFVWNPLGLHRLCYYDLPTNTHAELCFLVNANLREDRYIFHAEVIDNVLWWTDGYFDGNYDGATGQRLFNPPFRLNLEKCVDYPEVTLSSIDVIKHPPFYNLELSYDTTGEFFNNLRGNLYQFRTQFIYEDGEESAWSPISRMEIPLIADYINGLTQPTPTDNQITIYYWTGSFQVKFIRIAVSVNKGQFGIFKVIDKLAEGLPDDAFSNEFYTGETSFRAVPLDTRNYDNVPQVAECMSKLVNEVCYTNIVSGYDKIVPDVTIAYPITEIGFYEGSPAPRMTGQFSNSHRLVAETITNQQITLSFENITALDEFQMTVGDYYNIPLRVDDVSIAFAYYASEFILTAVSILATEQDKRDTLLQAMGSQMVANINDAFALANPASGSYSGGVYTINLSSPYNFTSEIISSPIRPARLQNTHKTLKKGAKYKWYLQYYDRANRDGTALTIPAMEAEVPFVDSQVMTDLSFKGAPYKVQCEMTINHLPPIWATHYQILVSKDNGIGSFMQSTITHVAILDDGNYRLSLDKLYPLVNKGAVINHQIQKGDRVRFMTTGIDASETPSNPAYITTYFETEVLEYDATGGEDNSQAVFVSRFNLSLINWNENRGILVEIYTPTSDSEVENIFEIGEVLPIANPHTDLRFHFGNIQSALGLPTIQLLEYGDVYIRQRQLGSGYEYPYNVYYWYCEDPHYSDYFISNFNSQGRVAIEDVNAKQSRRNISIHGGKYLRDSNINNSCVFEFGDNTQEYDPQYGYAVRTFVDGKTLKVLQPQKENSVYLNGTYSVNGDGNESAPAFSEKVFGGFRPYEGTFGCSNAGLSVLVPKAGIFYFDSINNEFIYSVNNGQRRVSVDAFYQKGSKDFGDIVNGANAIVRPFLESEYNKVGFSVKSDIGENVITFDYDAMRFRSRYVFRDVFGFENIGDRLFAFLAVNPFGVYEMNQEGSYEYMGGLYTSNIDVISNVEPQQMKRFKSIQIQSRYAWRVDSTTDATATETLGQSSYLSEEWFKLLEGAWHSQYRKSVNTYPSKSFNYNLLNGRDLRSYAIRNRLIYVNASAYNEISLVVVESVPSEVIIG